jgi:ABC-2 type transport system ATP-binding protein
LAAITSVAGQTGISYSEGSTSLEDVFIQFMGRSTDNMA